jgi:cob(I)alamin adenosyltransferase
MKVYTKTGDNGQTGLLGGARVSKDHVRIEAYGTVDELNAWLGVLATHAPAAQRDFLVDLQRKLFTLGAELAADPAKPGLKIPHITDSDIAWIENQIDTVEEMVPPLRYFVLPGGDPLGAWAHVARTVCRRAERRIVTLGEYSPLSQHIVPFVNRISDYLFVLSRVLVLEAGMQEIPWIAE